MISKNMEGSIGMYRLKQMTRLGLSLIIALSMLASCQNKTTPPDGNNSGNGGTPTSTIVNQDTFVIADIFDIDSFDPAYAYDVASAGQIKNIYDTLIKFDGTSTTNFVPSLATEWTISPDGLTYRFKIRENVTFHNGNDLTPEDVEYSFERGMVQDYGQGPQWMFFEPLFGLGTYSSRTIDGLVPLEEIKGKIEVDGQWVEFSLTIPYPPFLQILASSWGSVVDKEWCIEHGDWDGTEESYFTLNNPAPDSSPIDSIANGTGPFKLEYWQPAEEISLIRNQDYWGEQASFERLITKIVGEWSLRRLMLEQGDADCAVVPNHAIGDIKDTPGISIYDQLPILSNLAFFFQFEINSTSIFVGSGELDGNGIRSDFFSDSDVRKGFAYAFDWETFVDDALLGYGQQIATPIVEGLPFYNDEWQYYSLDLSKAEEHLRAAWDGEVWENGFEFTLAYAANDVVSKAACEILQANLFNVNPEFKINIQIMNWPNLLAEMILGRLPIFVNGWTADYPDPHNFLFPFMHSQGTFSGWQNYNNQTVDELIETAFMSLQDSERQSIYDQLAEIYYQDVPSIVISQNLAPFVFREWIKGFEFNPIKLAPQMYVYDLEKT
jgi:peptide/nickel transport system substrate-binding protein